VSLSDLWATALYPIFVQTQGPKNEDTFSDNIQRNRQSAYTAPEDSQGIALVASRKGYYV